MLHVTFCVSEAPCPLTQKGQRKLRVLFLMLLKGKIEGNSLDTDGNPTHLTRI